MPACRQWRAISVDHHLLPFDGIVNTTPVDSYFVWIAGNRKGNCEIIFFQQSQHRLNVVGQPKVVVGEVADNFTACLLQCRMKVRFSAAWSLWIIEEANPI